MFLLSSFAPIQFVQRLASIIYPLIPAIATAASTVTGSSAVHSRKSNGKRALTTDLAMKIESTIGLPAKILLSAQAHYELEVAGAEVKKPDSRHETVSITIPAQDHNLLQEIVKRFGWACVF